MKAGDYDLPDDLYYSKEHEWVRPEGNHALVGITDYAQKTLRDVVYVDLPPAGKVVKQFESLGAVESVKAASEIYSPVGGKVVAVNKELEDKPELLNQSPYDKGWLVRLEPGNLQMDLSKLLRASAYGEYLVGIKK